MMRKEGLAKVIRIIHWAQKDESDCIESWRLRTGTVAHSDISNESILSILLFPGNLTILTSVEIGTDASDRGFLGKLFLFFLFFPVFNLRVTNLILMRG